MKPPKDINLNFNVFSYTFIQSALLVVHYGFDKKLPTFVLWFLTFLIGFILAIVLIVILVFLLYAWYDRDIY